MEPVQTHSKAHLVKVLSSDPKSPKISPPARCWYLETQHSSQLSYKASTVKQFLGYLLRTTSIQWQQQRQEQQWKSKNNTHNRDDDSEKDNKQRRKKDSKALKEKDDSQEEQQQQNPPKNIKKHLQTQQH